MMHESIELIEKLVNGIDTFNRLREQEIEIGVTPKQEVYREDKVVLYHF
ncbi:hypothetical protein [Nostoc sp. 'Peltigera malacea cyanobiont' DB3992]|nr:hypothetical protein [Nostoc sp. 'Peltigera malacea cyanobiont' DB3992]